MTIQTSATQLTFTDEKAIASIVLDDETINFNDFDGTLASVSDNISISGFDTVAEAFEPAYEYTWRVVSGSATIADSTARIASVTPTSLDNLQLGLIINEGIQASGEDFDLITINNNDEYITVSDKKDYCFENSYTRFATSVIQNGSIVNPSEFTSATYKITDIYDNVILTKTIGSGISTNSELFIFTINDTDLNDAALYFHQFNVTKNDEDIVIFRNQLRVKRFV